MAEWLRREFAKLFFGGSIPPIVSKIERETILKTITIAQLAKDTCNQIIQYASNYGYALYVLSDVHSSHDVVWSINEACKVTYLDMNEINPNSDTGHVFSMIKEYILEDVERIEYEVRWKPQNSLKSYPIDEIRVFFKSFGIYDISIHTDNEMIWAECDYGEYTAKVYSAKENLRYGMYFLEASGVNFEHF